MISTTQNCHLALHASREGLNTSGSDRNSLPDTSALRLIPEPDYSRIPNYSLKQFPPCHQAGWGYLNVGSCSSQA